MERVLELARKEVRQLRRDRQILPFLLIVPVFQLILFGYAISTDIKHVPVVVCDFDHTRISREISREIASSEYLEVVGQVCRLAEVDRWLDSGRATVALVIPKHLQRDLVAGRAAVLGVIVDGADPTAGTVAANYLVRYAQDRSLRMRTAALMRRGVTRAAMPWVEAETRYWYNPLLRSAWFMVPGAMAAIVGMAATIATALALVREREAETMEQLIVTPLKPWELMLGKTIPFLVIGVINVTAVLIANALIFHVPVRGNLGLLYGLAIVFLVSSLSVGLLISTVSRTQQQAILTAFFFLMPNFLLSGFIFPIENMPLVLQWVTELIPLRYFLVIVRSIFLKGTPAACLMDQAIPMALLSAGFMLLAVWRFRKRLD